MAILKWSRFLNPQARFCTVAIFEFNPSATALVMRCLKKVNTFGKCRAINFAAAIIGCKRLFISAGFYAHCDDDMSILGLVEADYAWVTTEAKRIAEKYAQRRIVSALEGGYELHARGRCAAAHIKVLSGLWYKHWRGVAAKSFECGGVGRVRGISIGRHTGESRYPA